MLAMEVLLPSIQLFQTGNVKGPRQPVQHTDRRDSSTWMASSLTLLIGSNSPPSSMVCSLIFVKTWIMQIAYNKKY